MIVFVDPMNYFVHALAMFLLTLAVTSPVHAESSKKLASREAARHAPGDQQTTGMRVLQLVNEARSQARNCGSQWFAAATPLTMNSLLTAAAQAHSMDMAKHAYFNHEGRDGSTPAQRITRVGYHWSQIGENIAAGIHSADEVVAGWLTSPAHCVNIMTAAFTEMGIAHAPSGDDYGIYWTQVFATPLMKTPAAKNRSGR